MKCFKLMRSIVCLIGLSLISTSLFAQQKVSGTVLDETGFPLIGATVVEKGTNNGVITDFDGNYTLTVANAESVLDFRLLGMKAQEATVGKQTTINITMLEDSQLLDQVVVVGYGSMKKSDVTGSVASVSVDKLPSKPANSIDGLLQGQSAGVSVVTSSDTPGAGSSIRIRGGSSLNAGNDPLVVVDGFPLGNAGDLKQISPNDIASIEVLKDASAAAIYGSRGANGVIMITTKKGSNQKMEISINNQTTVSEFTSKLNLWSDNVLMAELSNEGRRNGGFNELYIGAKDSNGIYYPSISELSSGSWEYSTDWADLVFRNPVSTNTNVSLRNQTEKTQFSLSATYFTDQGVDIQDDFSKFNANLNLVHKLTDKFTVGTNVILSNGNRRDNSGLAYWRNPIFPVYNNDDPTQGYFMIGSQDYSHPIALTEKRMNDTEYLDMIASAFGEYKILPYLSIKSQINYKYGATTNSKYDPKKYTLNGTFNNGAATLQQWNGSNMTSETFLTFNKEIAPKHHLNAMAGFSYQYDKGLTTEMKAFDFLNESLGYNNLGVGDPEKNSVYNAIYETVMYSYLGRINYSYDDKYLATVTLRADGSSKFGQNNRWATFPSGALGWKLHNEEFIKNLDIFDQFKLRGSYGVSGNQGVQAYLINSRYGTDKYYDDGSWKVAIGPGYIVGWDSHTGKKTWGGIPNPDLRWETTNQFNVGLDLGFFNNRLRVTADYYYKYTYDLLREKWLSPSSSYDRMWVNSGEIKNNGVELTVDGNILETKDWSVNATAIVSVNRNEVVNLGADAEFGLSTDELTGMKYEFFGNTIEAYRGIPRILGVGEAVGVYYGYIVDGIIQNEAEGLAAGLTGIEAQAGEFKYVDLNNDGRITDTDRTVIGDPNPDFIASLNLSARYKNFDLALFFNGSYGGDILNTKAFSEPSNMPLRWTQDNRTQLYPSLRDGRQIRLSNWYIQDGSFTRLQNMTIGYTIPDFNSKYFAGGRIYVNATNLFTLTDFEGYDPELGLDGIYWGGTPRLRDWTIGIELKF